MEKKSLLVLVVIFLALSHVTSVPATRSLVAEQADPSVQDHHDAEVAKDLKTSSEEAFEMEGEAGEGRMMTDVADYPGARANPAHNPRSPGRPGF